MQPLRMVLVLATAMLAATAPRLVLAWDNVFTHPAIMRAAAHGSDMERFVPGIVTLVASGAKLDGLQTQIAGTSAIDWLRSGGNYEDRRDDRDYYACWSKLIAPRVVAHFHDPTKVWSAAGLTDAPLLDLLGLKIGGGPSALLWALQDDQQICGEKNEWTWLEAREHFHAAMTKTTPIQRDLELGFALRALGQVAHLLQDMAVPAHVRNDAHALAAISKGFFGFNIESWAAQSLDECNDTLCVGGVPLSPDAVLPDQADLNSLGLSALWDTGKLRAGAPPSASLAQGLAEYASANFLSRHTRFKGYTYPSPAGTKIAFGPMIDGKRPLLCAKTEGDPVAALLRGGRAALIDAAAAARGKPANQVDRSDLEATLSSIAGGLSVPCVDTMPSPKGPGGEGWELDPTAYPAHARMLVPRAVGYSRALFNYFARGKLGIAAVGTDNLSIRNLSTETMGGSASSTLSIYYDDSSGTRHLLTSTSNVSLPAAGAGIELSFTAPKDAKTVLVIFRGPMGLEKDAVVAQPISGPYQLLFLTGGSGANGINNLSHIVGMGAPPLLQAVRWLPGTDAPEALTTKGIPQGTILYDIDDRMNVVGAVPGEVSTCQKVGTGVSCPAFPRLWNLDSQTSVSLALDGHWAGAGGSIDRQRRVCGAITDDPASPPTTKVTWDGVTGALLSTSAWTCSTGAKTKNSAGQSITDTTLFDGSATLNWTDLVSLDAGTTLDVNAINDIGQVVGSVCCFTTKTPSGGTLTTRKAVLIQPPDADGDRVADTVERLLGTDPALADSDGDGIGDGDEIAHATDPLDPLSK